MCCACHRRCARKHAGSPLHKQSCAQGSRWLRQGRDSRGRFACSCVLFLFTVPLDPRSRLDPDGSYDLPMACLDPTICLNSWVLYWIHERTGSTGSTDPLGSIGIPVDPGGFLWILVDPDGSSHLPWGPILDPQTLRGPLDRRIQRDLSGSQWVPQS